MDNLIGIRRVFLFLLVTFWSFFSYQSTKQARNTTTITYAMYDTKTLWRQSWERFFFLDLCASLAATIK